ncbi:unnamed protein product [Didymodactylos carnosus]|uniref:Uncharacterized protein n=1 Tax=Didymodactylos carnosus TaxID=1234261 RepID=A0A8S2DZK3_9BILA|nr:unnamed protein product [Didymodactylos carnosus]CAF3788261.1 unnamed protein product [Didymodactylos carnosus]
MIDNSHFINYDGSTSFSETIPNKSCTTTEETCKSSSQTVCEIQQIQGDEYRVLKEKLKNSAGNGNNSQGGKTRDVLDAEENENDDQEHRQQGSSLSAQPITQTRMIVASIFENMFKDFQNSNWTIDVDRISLNIDGDDFLALLLLPPNDGTERETTTAVDALMTTTNDLTSTGNNLFEDKENVTDGDLGIVETTTTTFDRATLAEQSSNNTGKVVTNMSDVFVWFKN